MSKHALKNKSVIQSPIEEKGNAQFNLKDADPVDPSWKDSVNAITAEDMALDRELDRLAQEQGPPPDIDPVPAGVGLKKESEVRVLLSEFVDDYLPARTITELKDQVYLAKANGCDSVECTLEVGKSIIRDGSLETVGYFTFQDVKVYIVGSFEKASARDKRTTWDVEEKR
jgi:hypothetical protein